jgi:eukaryotic-like serine/threonine-protein kinase
MVPSPEGVVSMLLDVVRLGGDLELDPRAYELRRSGRRLKLERIPMELLLLLVERRGELVTREEIIERIWGKDVFLDTDSGINAAIRKIRQVLKDDPEKPLFLETITGKGYRFVAPIVEVQVPVGGQGGSPGKADVPGSELVRSGDGDLVGATLGAKAAAPSGIGKRWKVIVPAAVVALALSIGAYLYFHRAPKLTDKDTIVLADFTNTTGDSVFDGTLRQGLAVQLEQSPFLSLISEERIQQVLRLMDKPADARLTPEIAREICERTASAAVLDGSIASLGSQYVIGLRARDCRTGAILAEEQVQAARKEDVLNALGQVVSRFRTRVGESLATVEKHNTPLAEATTPSLEALKAYSAAWKVLYSTGTAAAVPLFQQAIEIDPKFAMAYASLGRMYSDLGESDLSAESTSHAYQWRDRASDAEKFFITASYEMEVTGNLERAQETCELWIDTYPRAMIPHAFLSGIILPALGNYEKAIEEAKKAIALDPDFAIGYSILAYSYQELGRLGEADATLQQAVQRKLEITDLLVQQYDLAFLQGDQAGMERIKARAQGNTEAEDWIADHEAFVLAHFGHLQQATVMSQRAVNLAQQTGHRERAAVFQTTEAVREGLFGDTSAATRSALSALQITHDREVEYGAALTLALAADSHARTLVEDLERRFPEDTSVKFSYVPTVRAVLALNLGEPSKAVELLQVAAPYELGVPRSSMQAFFGALYPIYVRGQAFLAAGRGNEAAAEFQKVIDHRGVVVSDPIGALAHLQLGRAYALTGDKDKARTAYGNLLALWKEADPDIPVLKQAKAEYAKLQ